MKPIEAGCLAITIPTRIYPHADEVRVLHQRSTPVCACLHCGQRRDSEWVVAGLRDGYKAMFECVLLRTDGDPDAVAVDERQEVEA
jgi:hypothetical protein